MQKRCDPALLPQVQILWDYMNLREVPKKADCIVGFGCYNEDIPREAARLYHLGYSDRVLFTGGLGRNTKEMWTESEADRFKRIAMAEGVPESAILIENKSTNTAENILFTRAVLEANGIFPKTILGVHKPYMQRRIAAAFPVYWPEVEFLVTSWPQTMAEYMEAAAEKGRSEVDTVNMIVGDFQRIEVYAEKGYQIPQEIPQAAWDAFKRLCQAGFTQQIIQ